MVPGNMVIKVFSGISYGNYWLQTETMFVFLINNWFNFFCFEVNLSNKDVEQLTDVVKKSFPDTKRPVRSSSNLSLCLCECLYLCACLSVCIFASIYSFTCLLSSCRLFYLRGDSSSFSSSLFWWKWIPMVVSTATWRVGLVTWPVVALATVFS